MKHKQGPGKDLFTVNGWENATVLLIPVLVVKIKAGCAANVNILTLIFIPILS